MPDVGAMWPLLVPGCSHAGLFRSQGVSWGVEVLSCCTPNRSLPGMHIPQGIAVGSQCMQLSERALHKACCMYVV